MDGGLKESGLHMYAAHAEDSSLLNWFNPGTFDGTTVNSPGFTINSGIIYGYGDSI